MSLFLGTEMDKTDALRMNPLQLAYLGDSVWELIIRYQLFSRKMNVHHMHQNCVKLVNAHIQSQILHAIYNVLSEEEKDIVRRGRNAHAKHTIPRNLNPEEYAASTGFEALFGYLYTTGQNERISYIVSHIQEVYVNA